MYYLVVFVENIWVCEAKVGFQIVPPCNSHIVLLLDYIYFSAIRNNRFLIQDKGFIKVLFTKINGIPEKNICPGKKKGYKVLRGVAYIVFQLCSNYN